VFEKCDAEIFDLARLKPAIIASSRNRVDLRTLEIYQILPINAVTMKSNFARKALTLSY